MERVASKPACVCGSAQINIFANPPTPFVLCLNSNATLLPLPHFARFLPLPFSNFHRRPSYLVMASKDPSTTSKCIASSHPDFTPVQPNHLNSYLHSCRLCLERDREKPPAMHVSQRRNCQLSSFLRPAHVYTHPH